MDRSPITVTVPGSQRKGRARSFIQGAHIAHYTPEKTRAHEGLIRRAALDQLGDKPAVEQPVEFSLRADFAVPPFWPPRKQQLALAGDIRSRKRPDLDNVLKNWLDGLSGASFVDDALIVQI